MWPRLLWVGMKEGFTSHPPTNTLTTQIVMPEMSYIQRRSVEHQHGCLKEENVNIAQSSAGDAMEWRPTAVHENLRD
ncbi:hypothetical protein HPP92_023201 [Vanilla planifolia]|uniref:Uncharacterized protein n=1 Tax=Vanilla planifolia TaxID=51239 RepID=A0A835UG48_VANPL|nr:hypothetical protein HPP92_023201 [Vanilla planifolia]